MIKVILIDDEPLAISIVSEYLSFYPNIEIVQTCNDGFEGMKAIQQHRPQLIFLDIQMPKINGFEMLEVIEDKPAVVFTTAFDEYAIKAFEANAIDYLLKPFTKDRFDKTMLKCLASLQNHASDKTESALKEMPAQPDEKNRVVVKNGNTIKIIPVQDILYFEAYDDYVKIYTKDAYHLKKKTMSHFESILDEKDFLRVHRSFMIQLNQITKIEPFEKNSHVALLKNGARIPLSRTGYVKLKESLGL
jgi:two-component system LytT family response regulator